MSGLEGQVGLVTGAGSGIGRATARELARRGVSVGVLDLDEPAADETAAEIAADGGTALAIRVDIGDESSVHDALDRVISAFGGLDVAVNNAGVPSTHQDITTMSDAEWHHVIAVNLTGTFWCMRHELPAMQKRGGGAIVNMGRGPRDRRGTPGPVAAVPAPPGRHPVGVDGSPPANAVSKPSAESAPPQPTAERLRHENPQHMVGQRRGM